MYIYSCTHKHINSHTSTHNTQKHVQRYAPWKCSEETDMFPRAKNMSSRTKHKNTHTHTHTHSLTNIYTRTDA